MSPRPFAAVALGALLGASCTLTTSLPDATDGTSVGGGGTAGGGGVGEGGSAEGGGGAGGGTGGTGGMPATSPADWASALGAVYRFETEDLGFDSSDNGITLLPVDGPMGVDDAKQGLGALLVSGSQRLESGDGEFLSEEVTFGAWFKTDANEMGSPHVIGLGDSYYLKHSGDNGTCFFSEGATSSNDGLWVREQWVHVVCRRSARSALGSIFVNGALKGTNGPTTISFDGVVPFRVGEAFAYAGKIDEAFFVPSALSNASVERIHACGIDGTRCTCSTANPAEYESCGSQNGQCDGLPPCNAAAPTFE